MKVVLILAAAALVGFAADNTLSPEEKREGFRLLFDGSTMKNWQDPSKKVVSNPAWAVENGTLRTLKGRKFNEDLISTKSYGDFELRFDWKLSVAGNSGLKYRLQKEIFLNESLYPGIPFEQKLGREIAKPQADRKTFTTGTGQLYTVGFEFQLIDDERHPDGRKDNTHQTGALYSFIAADKKAANAVGEWNSSVLILKGEHFEHWINGTKVLEGSLKDPRVREGAEKRWAPAPAVRDWLVNAKPTGPIALQHHGDEVWFRSIRIRELR